MSQFLLLKDILLLSDRPTAKSYLNSPTPLFLLFSKSINGNGEVLVEDIYQYLSTLEKAYNSAYVFNQIVEEAEEILNFYEGQKPSIPLKNLI
jgi:hypothetical protein